MPSAKEIKIPSPADIKEAGKLTKSHVHRTPVLTSKQVNEKINGQVYFKCENFQRVGAFKFRGACNTVFSIPESKVQKGVATHSSGNHAQAIALAAKMRGVPAYIVMPENAPKVKKRAVEGYGADITYCPPGQESRESTLEKVIDKTGANFIPSSNDPQIIAGQGTAALELLEEHPDLDMILVPVGGGGLASGTSIAVVGSDSDIKVIGCEPELADDAYLSLKKGRLVPAKDTQTIADGLRTGLGELTFACLQKHLCTITTVSEQQIIDAMRFAWERLNIIIEASSAVPLAALFSDNIDAENKKTAVIISGGNVDLDHLPWNS